MTYKRYTPISRVEDPHFFTLVKEDEDDNVGTLYFRGRLVVLVQRGNWGYDRRIMKEANDTPLSIHPGSTKMYQDIRQQYWWANMKQDIARYVSECDVCRRIKAEHQRPAGTLQPLSIPEWKWDKIEMDFVTGFPDHRKVMMPF